MMEFERKGDRGDKGSYQAERSPMVVDGGREGRETIEGRGGGGVESRGCGDEEYRGRGMGEKETVTKEIKVGGKKEEFMKKETRREGERDYGEKVCSAG